MEEQLNSIQASEPQQNVMDLGEWVLTVFISFLPLIGLIMLIIWSLSSQINPNKRNWARATLMIYLLFTVLYLIFMILFFGSLFSSEAFT
jgi:heme/copper-type cytochrome/quinol oxidase subunit 2